VESTAKKADADVCFRGEGDGGFYFGEQIVWRDAVGAEFDFAGGRFDDRGPGGRGGLILLRRLGRRREKPRVRP